MLIDRTSADDADARIALLHAIERARFHPFLQRFGALDHDLTARFRKGGHHDPFGRIALVGLLLNLGALPHFNRGFRVRDAYGRTHHEGNIELLGKVIGAACEIERFLRIGRLKNGYERSHRIIATVLLVLRREHARIVGSKQEHSTVNAGVRGGEERIGAHIHTHVLHRNEHACTRRRSTHRNLERDLFVRAPFRVDARKRCEGFHGLGGRCSWIGSANMAPCLPRTTRDRFIT